MIGIKSHHIMTAKAHHVREIKKEVLQQLRKYQKIFKFLLKNQAGNTQLYDVNKSNEIRVILSISNVKNRQGIDPALKCIKLCYRRRARELLDMLNEIEADVDQILGADRETLITLINKHKYQIQNITKQDLERIFEKIFNYNKFSKKAESKYSAYTLNQNLRITSCPYCNRMYTLTVICQAVKNKNFINYVTRPELDHYFPKSKYPLFGLSFNNLIPSCSICNKLKGSGTNHIQMHHHPYFDETKLDFRLNGIKYVEVNNVFNERDEWDVELDENGCKYTKESIEVFRLQDIYREHYPIIEDMIEKAQKYNQTFIDSVENLFSADEANPSVMRNVGFEREELMERIFGVLPSEEDQFNPMNKFKRAIYQSIRDAQNVKIRIQ
ncbi:hypothetical protein Q9R46_19700 [Paenibacillus sp. RRE4]|uniref:hypothetical protein n=1 Tax=Paenibacillus sp. RRE4 TaxID=2962587 RepID=UPI0028817D33|nr:hypothetical protein [Paenibacillus sp. RRE4]MDT0124899.1 hypothetical protein [Paenibacillus sp. RRE4]